MSRSESYTLNKKLEKLLVSARKAKGITQIDLAKRLKKPQSFVSKYETGERRLTVGDFVLVCAALRIKPAAILAKL